MSCIFEYCPNALLSTYKRNLINLQTLSHFISYASILETFFFAFHDVHFKKYKDLQKKPTKTIYNIAMVFIVIKIKPAKRSKVPTNMYRF